VPHAAGQGGTTGLRVSAPRHGQRVLRRAAQSGAAPYQGDANRSAPQFADYLLQIVAAYPEADTIHLVMDNLSSHRRKALVNRYGERIGGLLWDRFTVHYTPKHGSRLNQAEIEISLFGRECLGLRRIPSLRDLSREAQAWNRRMNRDHVVISWKFKRKNARQKFGYKRNQFRLSAT
jgi:hypothetical protein